LHQRFEQSDLPSRREHRNGEAGGEAGRRSRTATSFVISARN
jgi:hypothetical protein